MGMAVKECFTEEGTAEPRGENPEIEGHDILRPTGSKREVAKPKRCPLNAPGECQERNVNRNPKGQTNQCPVDPGALCTGDSNTALSPYVSFLA